MPYININEYDKTITSPKTSNGNIVAIPINATDGPSDRWVVVNTYDEFIQTFGPNPDTTSLIGNSWEYAANLLLRNMAVCVRRITHVLNEDGSNSSEFLPNVTVAKAPIKIADVVGNALENINLTVTTLAVSDVSEHSLLQLSDKGIIEPNEKYKTYSDNLGSKNTLFPSIWALENYDEFKTSYSNSVSALNNCFADVVDDGTQYPYTSTEHEWRYTGRKLNPHYKWLNEGVKAEDILKDINNVEYDTYTTILKNDSTKYNNGENAVLGDFFLIQDDDGQICRVDFTKPYENENLIYDDKYIPYNTPDYLFSLNNVNLTNDSFAEVTYDKEQSQFEEKVWKYTNTKVFLTKNEFEEFDENLSKDSSVSYPLYVYVVNDTSNSGCIYCYEVDHTTREPIQSKIDPAILSRIEKFKLYKESEKFKEEFEEEKQDTLDILDELSNRFSVVKNRYYAGTFDSVDNLRLYKGRLLNGSFAIVKNDKSDNIYEYVTNTINTNGWTMTNLSSVNLKNICTCIDEYDVNVYSENVLIPWLNTGADLNTGIYKRTFNWKKATDSEKNKYFIYTHWENSNKPIGTTAHETVRNAKIKLNEVVINGVSDTEKTSLTVNVNKWSDIGIDKDFASNKLNSGKVSITNTNYDPLKIYSFKILQKSAQGELSTVYNMNLERILSVTDGIIEDPLLKVVNANGEEKNATAVLRPQVDLTQSTTRWYVELAPGETLYYNKSLTGFQFITKFAIFDESRITYNVYDSSNGDYELTFFSYDTLSVEKSAIPTTELVEDIDNLSLVDNKANFNLFVAEYLYPGSNGNDFNLRVKTITNQGIYIYVYKGSQYLERIELCAFRSRLANGKIQFLDVTTNIDDIWRIILSKFGIYLGINDKSGITPSSIYSNYVKISLNPSLIDYDSYDYVNSLFAQDGTQISYLKNGSNPSTEHVIHEINYCYKPLEDKYRYDITFVANGGFIDDFLYADTKYSSNNTIDNRRLIEDAMLELTNNRKDCVAFLDAPYDAPVDVIPYYFEHISSSYAAAYDPWCFIQLATGSVKWMPPSFVQLYTHAKSIANGNKMYLPPAGVRRALVPEIISTSHDLTSSYITKWQSGETPQYVNPILYINGYDYSVYGQKTLYTVVSQSELYESTLQNLNVRLVANQIKKLIFKTCIDLTFELNNIMTWNEFKSSIEPTLSSMKGEGILNSYDIIMGTETMTAADLNSGHIVGTVKVAITSAATDWDINFEIQPNTVTFFETDNNGLYTE